ncbi:hypothetical protein B7R25_16430 [Subtercola boreus]|uniref:Uncharacterized protein n=1 Tax=Subtercola boreus TaxID=120213 RepID=A0A3E0W766_9MICO|nr:hypothetical protein B7R25_16430 [Subtercola boreus]
MYEDPDATEKVVSDWAELITNDNQIVYGRNWFATGPKDLLYEMFRDYEKSGPQTSIPAVASLTTEESNLSLCSSITYNVVTDSLTGTDETSLAPYFDNYPGLKQLRTDIVRTATGAGLDKTTSADAYLASIFLTRYDSQIKDFCAAFS